MDNRESKSKILGNSGRGLRSRKNNLDILSETPEHGLHRPFRVLETSNLPVHPRCDVLFLNVPLGRQLRWAFVPRSRSLCQFASSRNRIP